MAGLGWLAVERSLLHRCTAIASVFLIVHAIEHQATWLWTDHCPANRDLHVDIWTSGVVVALPKLVPTIEEQAGGSGELVCREPRARQRRLHLRR